MRTRKTVLVLGAGASYGFGLPLGQELKTKIADDLNIMFDDFGNRLVSGSHEIVSALRIITRDPVTGQPGNINDHRKVAVRISQAMGPSGSIDEYVERHRGDSKYSECAKLAIAKNILEGERNSSIYMRSDERESDIINRNSESWLSMMLRDITRRHDQHEVAQAFKNLSIVNFNYDRCFEEFTFLWLKQIYGLSDESAADICNSIEIFHPYGKIGDLSFQRAGRKVHFGEKVSAQALAALASTIRTFSESVDDHDSLMRARLSIASADQVVFLGFGFHEQNIELLKIPNDKTRITIDCFATTKDISTPKIEVDKERVMEAFRVTTPTGFRFNNTPDTCEKFWQDYGGVIVR